MTQAAGTLSKYCSASAQVGAKWLGDWCMRHCSALEGSDVNSLATVVATAALGGRSGDELAAELFNLLGYDYFDAVQVGSNLERSFAD